MSTINPEDLYEFDETLTPAERLKRDELREYFKDLIPSLGSYFERGEVPANAVEDFSRLGLFGITLKGYGGSNATYRTYGLMMRELERADSGLRSLVSVQNSLVIYPLSQWAHESVQKKFLPDLASGKALGCFGLTEPDHGSDPGSMETTATKTKDGYMLKGKKRWLTNGTKSQVAIIWAKDSESQKILGFAVPTDAPGVQFSPLNSKFSLRISYASELELNEVHVPKNHQLQIEGLKGPFKCLHQARYGIAWGVLGAASACLDEVLAYTSQRKQFDKPLSAFQLIQAKLAHMACEITKGQALATQLSQLFDSGRDKPHHVSLAKMNNVSQSLACARLARDILGANGITYEYQTARHLLNLETVNTYEGTEDIHRLVVGQTLTGVPAFR